MVLANFQVNFTRAFKRSHKDTEESNWDSLKVSSKLSFSHGDSFSNFMHFDWSSTEFLETDKIASLNTN